MSDDDATVSKALNKSSVLYWFCVGDGDLPCSPRLRRRLAGGFTMVEGVLRSWFSYDWSTQGS